MLGIDVSKQTLTCTLLSPEDRHCRWHGSVPNTVAGVRQVLHRTAPTDPWVVEPTGIYSRTVVQHAQAAGRPVLLAQPKRAKAFLAATQPRAKTDRVDSRGLALYGLSAPLRPFPVTSEAMERIEQLLAARKGISENLAQARAVLPVIDALDGIPGIGPVTATAVAACLVAKQFAHPDQFVAYIGLDTRVSDSGQRAGKRALTKQGDAELRRLLYLCAQANARSKDGANPFKAQYERERAKGLPTTGALCVVARKLARTCWSLERHGTQYVAARVHTQPASPRTERLDNEP